MHNNLSIPDLSLPVVLHHGQVFSQVFQADLQFRVLCAGEVKQLSHQLVCRVSELCRLPGVRGQQGAQATQVPLSMFHRLLHALYLDIPAGTSQDKVLFGNSAKRKQLINILVKAPQVSEELLCSRLSE